MENVLTVKASLLAPYISGRNGLIKDNNKTLLRLINENHVYIPRDEAENDPSYKQVIPYVILTQGDKVFCTRRLKKGGEARLHGLISIGIGGHINPSDEDQPGNVLMCGLERELSEEVSIEERSELIPCGFINDDSNGVGSVHIGMCFKMSVSGSIEVKETEKLEGLWATVEELKAQWDGLETWTQIALEAL